MSKALHQSRIQCSALSVIDAYDRKAWVHHFAAGLELRTFDFEGGRAATQPEERYRLEKLLDQGRGSNPVLQTIVPTLVPSNREKLGQTFGRCRRENSPNFFGIRCNQVRLERRTS